MYITSWKVPSIYSIAFPWHPDISLSHFMQTLFCCACTKCFSHCPWIRHLLYFLLCSVISSCLEGKRGCFHSSTLHCHTVLVYKLFTVCTFGIGNEVLCTSTIEHRLLKGWLMRHQGVKKELYDVHQFLLNWYEIVTETWSPLKKDWELVYTAKGITSGRHLQK